MFVKAWADPESAALLPQETPDRAGIDAMRKRRAS